MDMNRRAVLHMLVRRLGDGDKAQYIPHFTEAREVTVGEYQEFMEDGIRKLDILRDMGGAGIVGGGPSMLPALLEAAAENTFVIVDQGVTTLAAAAEEHPDRMDMLRFDIAAQMGIPSHLLGRSDK